MPQEHSPLLRWLTPALALLVLGVTECRSQTVLFASPGGSAANDGSKNAPLDLATAIQRGHAIRANEDCIVRLQRGVYRVHEPIELRDRDGAESPHRLLIEPDGPATVRGSFALDPTAFERPTPAERERLPAIGRDRVLAQTVDDPRLIAELERELVLGLVVNGRFCLPSVFPNEGYARFAKAPAEAEVSPPAVPVGKQDYGVRAGHPPFQVDGRPQGWLGSLADPRGAWARLADDEQRMAGTWTQWAAELARNNRRNRLTGFLDANWLQRSQPVVAADPERRAMHLSQALAYGWAWRGNDKPFRIFGMLCELDAPGEWHFDPATRRLFLLPFAELSAATSIELPVSAGFLHLRGTSRVEVRGLDLEFFASGSVFWLDGRDNLVAACTIRSTTACAVRLTGTHERVAGCDIVDCRSHVALAGGRRGPRLLEAGGNVVENCHCYQRHFGHERVNIGVRGVGNTLRDCLIHNSLGQAVTVHGNDHVIERNELCNIGYEEGDGGAIYAGADLGGYGVVYRHNFFHHLMHVPGKVERSGIHLDDLQAGATCIGNVFYKSAGKGIFMNGGAGHTITGNVFLAGFRGVYNVGHGAETTHRRQQAILSDPEHTHRSTKENYIGRLERQIGERGWTDEPWRSRYPRMLEVLSDSGRFGRLWPIRCDVRDNWFHDNERGDHTIWSRVAKPARKKSTIRGDRTLDPSVFRDYDALDLRVRTETVAGTAPAIPFASIGLQLDENRSTMPDVAHLRRELREFFRGVRSMPGTTRHFDTGALVDDGPVIKR